MKSKRFSLKSTLVMSFMYSGSNCKLEFNTGDIVWIHTTSGNKISGVLTCIGNDSLIVLEPDETSAMISLDRIIDMGAK